MNVLPCSLRNDCAAEIYGIDFSLENAGNTVTVDGFCQVEGTCGSTEYLTSNVVTLTYGTCNGTYEVMGGTDLTITTASGSATLFAASWDATTIALEVENAVGGWYTDGDGYEFADTDNINPFITRDPPSGAFNFPCRWGDPYLTCANTNSCVVLDQRRPIG